MANFFNTRKEILQKKLSPEERREVTRLMLSVFKEYLTRRDILIMLAACLLNIGYNVLLPLINRSITDYAVTLYGGGRTVLAVVIVLIILLPLMSTLLKTLRFFNGKVSLKLMKNVDIGIKERVMEKMATVKLDYFNDPDFADRQFFINLKASDRIYLTAMNLPNVLLYGIGALSSLGIILANYPLAALICLAAAVPMVICSDQTNQILYFDDYWEIPAYKKMAYAFEIMTKGNAAHERMLYDYAPEAEKRFAESHIELKSLRKKASVEVARNSVIGNLCSTAALTAVLLLVTRDIIATLLTVGVFSLMVSAVQNLFGGIHDMLDSFFYIKVGAKYCNSILEMEQLRDEPAAGDTRPDLSRVEIKIEDLRFSYPGTDAEVLKGIDLTIRNGEKIALVGRNGCGKSTLVSLLTGIYTPDAGRILINEHNLQDCLDALRKATACTLQNFNKYEISIADNVRVGDVSREIPDDELRRVCEDSGVLAFAEEFPEGLDTVLGSMGESGAGLSGGQWQRVMMARALIRKGASLLIFDEPTAALDPKAEAELYRDFGRLTGNRTTITISHRLGITTMVDRILVMDDGRIIEDGSHEQLMAQDGLYARMFRSQAQWYE